MDGWTFGIIKLLQGDKLYIDRQRPGKKLMYVIYEDRLVNVVLNSIQILSLGPGNVITSIIDKYRDFNNR